MSELEQIKKLIQLNGDEAKYSEGMKILNSGMLTSSDNTSKAAIVVGAILVFGALWANPKLLAPVQTFIESISEQRQELQQESDSPDQNASQYPPQPPEISTPAPAIAPYYQPPQPPVLQQPAQVTSY